MESKESVGKGPEGRTRHFLGIFTEEKGKQTKTQVNLIAIISNGKATNQKTTNVWKPRAIYRMFVHCSFEHSRSSMLLAICATFLSIFVAVFGWFCNLNNVNKALEVAVGLTSIEQQSFGPTLEIS